MNKKTFAIAMAIEIPIAFVVLTLLLNNMSDWVFYVAWAIFAVVVSSLFVFLKKQKDCAFVSDFHPWRRGGYCLCCIVFCYSLFP